MSKNPFNKVLKLIGIIEAIDLLTINIILALCLCGELLFNPGSKFEAHFVEFWALLNITYFVSINIVYGMLHSRLIRPESLITQAFRTMLLQTLLFMACIPYTDLPVPSIFVMFGYFLITFILVTFERLLLRHILKHVHHEGHNTLSVIFLGDGEHMKHIAEIMNDKWNGYRLIGSFHDNPNVVEEGIPHLGYVSEAYNYLRDHHVDEVYCGLNQEYIPMLEPFIRLCDRSVTHFFVVPTVQQVLNRRTFIRDFGEYQIITFHPEPMSIYYNRILKRIADVITSSLFVFTLYPFIYAIVAIITKLTNPGPVYFRQERTGFNGRTFLCLKFRSMKVNDKSDELQATANDSRVTRFGRFLRKSNIDELPQFINVLRGEMSVVGPRPHMLKHTEYYSSKIGDYMIRHYIRPGITGWAQINGSRGETKTVADMDERVRKDIWYIENWTIWLDMFIILKTVYNMIIGDKKAY